MHRRGSPTLLSQVRELVGEGQSGQYTARGGSIDFDFFCTLMGKKVKTLSNEEELKDAFRVLDKHGHGWITAKEMQLVCRNLGEDMEEEEVDKMIAEAISNYVRAGPGAGTHTHARGTRAASCRVAPPCAPVPRLALSPGSMPTTHARRMARFTTTDS